MSHEVENLIQENTELLATKLVNACFDLTAVNYTGSSYNLHRIIHAGKMCNAIIAVLPILAVCVCRSTCSNDDKSQKCVAYVGVSGVHWR